MVDTLRAYRFTLDLTPDQVRLCVGSAGAARWAYNHALALKRESHRQWQEQVDKLIADGLDAKDARRRVKVPIPRKSEIQKAWNQIKGDDREGIDGCSPWWHQHSTYVFQSAFQDADTAWKNWMESFLGIRAGRRVGYPQFKKRGRARDSFRLHHDVKRPTIRPDGYRRLNMPRIGSVRLHDSAKRLVRALKTGAVVQSVTVARGGHRWYASVLVKSKAETVNPTRRQREAGRVGVAIGVRSLATLSTGEFVPNPRHLDRDTSRLVRAQRKLSRTQRGSNRRVRAARRVGKIHNIIAERRAGTLHQLSKRLTTGWAEVALPQLDVVRLTESAHRRRKRGTLRVPPKVIATLNRNILDVAPGELKRQIIYKASWNGSRVALCEPGHPTSTCSRCGAAKTKLSPSARRFRCPDCGLDVERTVNAARVIARDAQLVASDTGDTQNARGGSVRRTASGSARGSSKREGPRGHPD